MIAATIDAAASAAITALTTSHQDDGGRAGSDLEATSDYRKLRPHPERGRCDGCQAASAPKTLIVITF